MLRKISILVFSLILLVSGYFVRVITEPCKEAEIEIVKETKTVVKYIKKPYTIEDYREAYESPININTKMLNPEWLRITASDGWKQSEKEIKFKYKLRETSNWKFYVGVGIGVAATGSAIYFIKKHL